MKNDRDCAKLRSRYYLEAFKFQYSKKCTSQKKSSFLLKSACWAPDFDLWFRLHYLWDDIGDVYWSTRKNLLLYFSGRTLKKMGCGGPEPTFDCPGEAPGGVRLV